MVRVYYYYCLSAFLRLPTPSKPISYAYKPCRHVVLNPSLCYIIFFFLFFWFFIRKISEPIHAFLWACDHLHGLCPQVPGKMPQKLWLWSKEPGSKISELKWQLIYPSSSILQPLPPSRDYPEGRFYNNTLYKKDQWLEETYYSILKHRTWAEKSVTLKKSSKLK